MKNYYSTVDGIVTTFSNIEEDRDGFDHIAVRFERMNNVDGFDFAEGKLPETEIYKTYGFSENELLRLKRYMRNNSALIWKIAQREGGTIA
ncbi:MAG: hypothetical protein LUF30_09305 [Lachnospiraceae bacterium]|nr:hypothetical protein [Lachnospiraceae bacterium]